MTRQYYISHNPEHGKRCHLVGYWYAASPEKAIARMLRCIGAEDDGQWVAHEVKEEQR